MSALQYVEPLDALRRLPIRHVGAALGISFDAEGRAVCPWHEDSRPSLEIYRSDDGSHERWKCFPCSALGAAISGGDVFSLIMRAEELSFPAAIERARLLARELDGLPAPPPAQPRPEIDPSAWEPLLMAARDEALRRQEDLERAAGFAHSEGWGWELANRWRWGLSEDGWALVPYFRADGLLTGIRLRHPESGRASVDGSRFRSLYGAWHKIMHYEYAVLCEGETDTVFAARQLDGWAAVAFGIPGAGAEPTEEMLAPLAPLSGRHVFLLFDGDDSGRAASVRWARAIDCAGGRAWVFPLPEGTDLRTCDLRVLDIMGMSAHAG